MDLTLYPRSLLPIASSPEELGLMVVYYLVKNENENESYLVFAASEKQNFSLG